MSPAWSSADSVISSAALRARRLSSWTVKMTGVSGAASLNWWASASAFFSSGRTLTREPSIDGGGCHAGGRRWPGNDSNRAADVNHSGRSAVKTSQTGKGTCRWRGTR